MPASPEDPEDDVLRSEYDLNELSGGTRGKYLDRIRSYPGDSVKPGELPPEHLEELDRRRAEAEANPRQGRPWREVLGES